jgi:hypothetical protein
MRLLLLLRSAVRLHGVYLQNRKTGLLLTGKSEAGKTTIAGILSKGGFSVLVDDDCRVFDIRGTVYISGTGVRKHKVTFLNSPEAIVFIERGDSLSESCLISRREAFKRLCFASEFPDFEKEESREGRLKILHILARQCRSLVLVNGRGLKDNPKLLKQLVLGRLKSAKNAEK